MSDFEFKVFRFCALPMQSLIVSIIVAIFACRAREFIFISRGRNVLICYLIYRYLIY